MQWAELKKDNQSECVQIEANRLWEGQEFELAQRYANHAKTLMIFLFFLPILPMGSVTGFFAILALSSMDKLVLVKFSRLPPSVAGDLAFEMYGFFDLILVAYAVSLN